MWPASTGGTLAPEARAARVVRDAASAARRRQASGEDVDHADRGVRPLAQDRLELRLRDREDTDAAPRDQRRDTGLVGDDGHLPDGLTLGSDGDDTLIAGCVTHRD